MERKVAYVGREHERGATAGAMVWGGSVVPPFVDLVLLIITLILSAT